MPVQQVAIYVYIYVINCYIRHLKNNVNNMRIDQQRMRTVEMQSSSTSIADTSHEIYPKSTLAELVCCTGQNGTTTIMLRCSNKAKRN